MSSRANAEKHAKKLRRKFPNDIFEVVRTTYGNWGVKKGKRIGDT